MRLSYFLVQFSSPFDKHLALKLHWSAVIKFWLALVHKAVRPISKRICCLCQLEYKNGTKFCELYTNTYRYSKNTVCNII